MRRTYWAAAAVVLAAAGSAQAGYTAISPGSEASLVSIFNSTYGGSLIDSTTTLALDMAGLSAGHAFSNGTYTFTRVNDNGGTAPTDLHSAYTGASTTIDTRFMDGSTAVTFTTKYAGYNNRLGWSNSTGAITEVGSGMATQYNDIIGTSGSETVTLSSNFQLVLNVGAGAGDELGDGVGHWGADTDIGAGDHFVTWYVTSASRNFWVVAVEDLNLGDSDYNDWVGELQVVPLPAGAWAGISSLVGVAGLGYIRRRRMKG